MPEDPDRVARSEFRVFVSSPSDVGAERRRAEAVLIKLNTEFDGRIRFTPICWEEFYYTADATFQATIPKPSSCELVVCILWKRLGSELPAPFNRPDGSPRTGTEYEFEEALQAALQQEMPDILVYRKRTKILFDSERVEQEQADLRALNSFWQKWFRDEQGHFTAGFDTFETIDEFGERLEKHLRLWLAHRDEQVVWPIQIKGSPFRGLEPFEAEHADVFFGRKRVVRQVIARLRTCAIRGHAFLLLLGMSGSGKSSLVRAAVIPWIVNRRAVPDVDEWRSCIVGPASLSKDPLAGLATALFADEALPELANGDHASPTSLTWLLRKAPDAIAPVTTGALRRAGETLRQRMGLERPVESRLILVIDQLEELFSREPAERDQIVAVIGAMARSGKVWVIATLRSDFYAAFQAVPALLALKEDGGSFDLQPPGPADVREIIQGPARAAGLILEQRGERDLGLLLEAAAQQPGSLPLLEFTLQSLFLQRGPDGKTLRLDVFDALGGLEGAIAREADKLVGGMPQPLQDALPGLLLALIDVDDEKQTATARTIMLSVLTDARQLELAERLTAGRLLVADGRGAQPMLRLAHEALLANWPRLSALVKEHFRFLIVRRRLQRDADAWIREGRPSDLLLPAGRRLVEAEEILSSACRHLERNVADYIAGSLEAEHKRITEAERAKEERRRRELETARRIARISRNFAIVAGALGVVAIAGGLYAWWERNQAQAALGQADRNYKSALRGTAGLVDIMREQIAAGAISTRLAVAMLDLPRATIAKLESEKENDEIPSVQWRLIDTLSYAYVALPGQGANAIEMATKERALAGRLLMEKPEREEYIEDAARSDLSLGIAYDVLGRLDEAAASDREGLVLFDRLAQIRTD